jgi:hypothetical protein
MLQIIVEDYTFTWINMYDETLNMGAAREALDMFFLNRKEKAKDNNNKTIAKCKHCSMEFDDKERLSVHDKKAHSGRGERKKKS